MAMMPGFTAALLLLGAIGATSLQGTYCLEPQGAMVLAGIGVLVLAATVPTLLFSRLPAAPSKRIAWLVVILDLGLLGIYLSMALGHSHPCGGSLVR